MVGVVEPGEMVRDIILYGVYICVYVVYTGRGEGDYRLVLLISDHYS